MCGSGTVETKSLVDIMYEGSKDIHHKEKICQCVISSSEQAHVNVKHVDIRLENFHKIANQSVANCSSALLSLLGRNIKCKESNKHYEVNFIYSESKTALLTASKNVVITLKNIFSQGQYDAPVMVWIAVQGRRCLKDRNLLVNVKTISEY